MGIANLLIKFSISVGYSAAVYATSLLLSKYMISKKIL